MSQNVNSRTSCNEGAFQSLSHYGPVTALKFHQDFVLCGYGPLLKIFQVKHFDNSTEASLILKQQVFKRNKIHWISISPDGSKGFVAGGKSFGLFKSPSTYGSDKWDEFQLEFNFEKAINEWIICGEFLDDNTILILTSHNVVYQVDISDLETGKFSLQAKLDCREKSILYSGSIQVDIETKRAVVAAGTVMNGVIIWDVFAGQILYNLTDHKGSIFGVKIDPTFSHIISCSDDRSVKLYDYATGELLALGWGHGSRIWNLQFLSSPKSDCLKLISTGEDCTVRIWKYVKDNSTLEQFDVIDNCHSGKHVWSCDVDSQHQLIVTGGNDGAVRLHDVGELKSNFHSLRYSLADISSSSDISFCQPEAIKQFVELKSLNYLICLSSSSQLFGLDQNNLTWHAINIDNNFKEFAIMKYIPHSNYIAVSSINGEILLLHFGKDLLTPIESKKILSNELGGNKVINMLIASDSKNGPFYVLLDSPNPHVPFIVHAFTFSKDEGSSEYSTIHLSDLFTLEKPAKANFTATYSTYDSTNNWLVVYSRSVGIMIYDLATPSTKCKLFKKITTGDTITSASILNSSSNSIQLLVVIRDGIYVLLTISWNGKDFSLYIDHENKIFRGFVEGGYFQGTDLILYGFRSIYFYVWNETKQLEIMKVVCGGSHRAWQFFTYEDNDSILKFICINKSELSFHLGHNRFGESHGLINSGTHGREVRDVVVSPYTNETDKSKLIITASEDTIIRFGKLFSNGLVKYFWSMNYHISGMQKVKFLNKDLLASSAANEELFIWKVSNIQLSDDVVPIVKLHSVLKTTSAIPDLRVMDFDSIEVSLGKFLLVTVYSDSHIKIWNFNGTDKTFKLLIDDFYTSCCILNCKFITMNERILLLITATDGHISIWDINDIIMLPSISHLALNETKQTCKLDLPIIRQQLHQNGIKGLHLRNISNSCIKIVTGGDDNSLILSTLTSDSSYTLKWQLNSFIEDAASSTITSISGHESDFRVVVTSVDQIVRLWDYSNDNLSLSSAAYTTVADTGCCDLITFNDLQLLIIGGVGLSVWQLT